MEETVINVRSYRKYFIYFYERFRLTISSNKEFIIFRMNAEDKNNRFFIIQRVGMLKPFYRVNQIFLLQ